MKSYTKALVGTLAVGAMALSSASPAFAQDRRGDRGGIDAGDVIAGALVIGGIAAIAAAIDNDDRRTGYRGGYDDRNDYRGGYNDRNDYRGGRNDRNRYNSRGDVQRAVEQCVSAAQRQAQRYSGSRAEVYEIRDVDRSRGGLEVKGSIAVQNRSWRGGWNNYRRNNNRNDGWDQGRFTCDYSRGRVTDIDFSGIRAL